MKTFEEFVNNSEIGNELDEGLFSRSKTLVFDNGDISVKVSKSSSVKELDKVEKISANDLANKYLTYEKGANATTAFMMVSNLPKDIIFTKRENVREDTLSEDANSIISAILGSASYKSLTKEIEGMIDAQAHDSDDYTMLASSIIPKLNQKLKSEFNIK